MSLDHTKYQVDESLLLLQVSAVPSSEWLDDVSLSYGEKKCRFLLLIGVGIHVLFASSSDGRSVTVDKLEANCRPNKIGELRRPLFLRPCREVWLRRFTSRIIGILLYRPNRFVRTIGDIFR